MAPPARTAGFQDHTPASQATALQHFTARLGRLLRAGSPVHPDTSQVPPPMEGKDSGRSARVTRGRVCHTRIGRGPGLPITRLTAEIIATGIVTAAAGSIGIAFSTSMRWVRCGPRGDIPTFLTTGVIRTTTARRAIRITRPLSRIRITPRMGTMRGNPTGKSRRTRPGHMVHSEHPTAGRPRPHRLPRLLLRWSSKTAGHRNKFATTC